jgi:hypothetical protein
VAQFLLSPLLLWRSFVATLLSNALYGLAFSYYHYITFLGYSSLPFLSDTVVRPIPGHQLECMRYSTRLAGLPHLVLCLWPRRRGACIPSELRDCRGLERLCLVP